MVELADTSDLGSDARKRVEVQVLLPAYAFAKDVFSAYLALFSFLALFFMAIRSTLRQTDFTIVQNLSLRLGNKSL